MEGYSESGRAKSSSSFVTGTNNGMAHNATVVTRLTTSATVDAAMSTGALTTSALTNFQ